MSMTLFAQNSLRAVQNIVVSQDFPERMMANGSIVPISTELPAWAKTYQYSIFTKLGSAKIMASGADDFPEVSAYAEQRQGVIKTIGNQYSYSWEDMQYAQQANVPLDSTLALTAREIMEQELDNVAWLGNADHNLLGFLGHANVPTYSVANDGTGSSTLWSTKTATQIFRDLTAFAKKTRVDTKQTHFAEVILMDDANYTLIAETNYPSGTDSTILEFFLKTQASNPFGVKRIIPVPYLSGAGTGGASIMVSYQPRPEKIRFHLPQGFVATPPEAMVNNKYTTICRMRTGGVQLLKVLSMCYADGI